MRRPLFILYFMNINLFERGIFVYFALQNKVKLSSADAHASGYEKVAVFRAHDFFFLYIAAAEPHVRAED